MSSGVMMEQLSGAMTPLNGNMSMTERLLLEQAQLTGRLNEINDVLDKLDANPDLKNILDAVAKLGVRM